MARKKGFCLNRSNIGERYIFIHFLTPVTAVLNGKNVRILPGGCVIWSKGSAQQFCSDECELVHDWFHALAGCEQLMEKYSLKSQTVYYPQNSAEITGIIEEIETEVMAKNPYYDTICTANAHRLFALLARSQMQHLFAKLNSKKAVFDKAREKIHSECEKSWNTASMARLVNMSQASFYRNYKSLYGTSPQQDLAHARILRAQLLLMQCKYPVTEAAEACGYNNQYHFIRTFKKIVGTTPGKYRNSVND